MIPNHLIRREMPKKIFFGGGRKRRRTAEAAVPTPFLLKIQLLTYQKRFCSNNFKNTREALNLRYTLMNENLKKI